MTPANSNGIDLQGVLKGQVHVASLQCQTTVKPCYPNKLKFPNKIRKLESHKCSR